MEQAQADAAAEEETHASSVEDAGAQHAEDVALLEDENASEQEAKRREAKGEVGSARGEWTSAQEEELSEADQEASEEIGSKAEEIAEEKQSAEAEAEEEVEEGNREAEAEREKGEAEAERERAKGEKESDGVFGWLASKAKAFFDAIKKGIQKALEVARAAVKKVIEAAKKVAVAIIEKARQAAIALVRAAGDFLIKLGGALLANFPALREKWEKAIKGVVAAAEDTINTLADALKTGIVALLDAYGALLDGALGLLEKGLTAIVDAVATAVDGAIDFAKSVADKLGTFAQLIADVASDPMGWLGNLGSSVVDGIRNHLWGAFKAGVQEWFNSKVEGLLSVGKTIWALVTGQLGFAEIGKMAWEAIKEMIPPTLIRILVEKLVAMIVPAAGALLAIIEGLQAAWGTVSRIIAAIDTFIAFLKAVKGGGAGPQFAQALVAAMIVVLDFVANYLLMKLGSGLKALAGKLKGIARHLMKKKRAAKAKGKRKPKGRPRRPARPKRRGRPPRQRAKGQTARRRRRDANQRRQERKRVQVPIPDGKFGDSLPFEMDSEGHRVTSKESGSIIVQSTPMTLDAFLAKLAGEPEHKNAKSARRIAAARAQGPAALKAAAQLRDLRRTKVQKGTPAYEAHRRRIREADDRLEQKLQQLRSTLSNLTGLVHINTARFWPGGRPSFSAATKRILAERWPHLHDENTGQLQANYDRRHIEAFSTIRKGYQADLHGRPVAEGVRYLAAKKHKPERPKNIYIEKAAKAALTDEFNDPDNLFPGASAENRRLGREMAQADRRAEKKEKLGDHEAAKEETKTAADRSIDAPKKEEQSEVLKKRDLSDEGKDAISKVQTAGRSFDPSQQGPRELRDLLVSVERAMVTLRREAQVLKSKREIGRVRTELQAGALLKRRIRAALGTGPKISLSDDRGSRGLL